MSETVRTYGCGCCEGPGWFVPCQTAEDSEHKIHKAQFDREAFESSASLIVQYPLTYDDPEYLERDNSIKDHAKKFSQVAAVLKDLREKEMSARGRESRAGKRISRHLRCQRERGKHTDKVIETPARAEPDFDEYDPH